MSKYRYFFGWSYSGSTRVDPKICFLSSLGDPFPLRKAEAAELRDLKRVWMLYASQIAKTGLLRTMLEVMKRSFIALLLRQLDLHCHFVLGAYRSGSRSLHAIHSPWNKKDGSTCQVSPRDHENPKCYSPDCAEILSGLGRSAQSVFAHPCRGPTPREREALTKTWNITWNKTMRLFMGIYGHTHTYT